jgi:integrase
MASYSTPKPKRVGANGKRRRSAGEGSVYQAADGRWRGAVTWTEPDGRRSRRVVSGRTSAEARGKLDELRGKLRIGALTPADAGSLAEYLAGWIERDRHRVRPSTWRSREMHVRCYLVPTLGRLALPKVTAADVERALAAFMRDGSPCVPERRRRPISAQTARHIRATLRRALNEAQRAGLVARNAAADASPPYVAHRPVSYLPAEDVRRLLDTTRDDPLGPLVSLAATTGLRLGELLGLAWSDIDPTAGTLTVRRSYAEAGERRWTMAEPKSARSRRTIPLPAVARAALERQRQRQDADHEAAGTAWQDRDGRIFTDTVGRPLTPGAASHAFVRLRDRLGLPGVRFHDLRHTAATMLLAEGVPLAVISEWLGHAGIAITAAHYAAVVPELRREAADAMDRAMGGAS